MDSVAAALAALPAVRIGYAALGGEAMTPDVVALAVQVLEQARRRQHPQSHAPLIEEVDPPLHDPQRRFRRCPRCREPVWRDLYEAHLAGCAGNVGKGRRGRPRKYPRGYRPPPRTQQGWLLRMRRIIGAIKGYRDSMGEPVLPIRLISSRLGISYDTLRDRLQRANVSVIHLQGHGRYGLAAIRERDLPALHLVAEAPLYRRKPKPSS